MNRLTKKQKGFVKDYVKTGNGQESALRNYDIEAEDKESVARAIATENLTKPSIIRAIAERLPDDLLEEKHLALLNKTEKKFNSDGDMISEEIDAQAVAKGLDMAYKVKGHYAPDKNININMSVKAIDPTDEAIIAHLKAIQDKLENEG